MPSNVSYTAVSLSVVLGNSGGAWTQTTAISLNDDTKTYRYSLSSSSNKLHIEFASLVALSEWCVYITPYGAPYGPTIGTKIYSQTNIAFSTSKSIDIPLISSYFTSGDSKYRISLYAQSQADGIWDVAEVFMVYNLSSSTYEEFVPADSDQFGVLNKIKDANTIG